jgi:hypothetical protein
LRIATSPCFPFPAKRIENNGLTHFWPWHEGCIHSNSFPEYSDIIGNETTDQRHQAYAHCAGHQHADGRGKSAPLDYVIETCSRQDAASVDLLIHGVVDTGKIAGLEKHLADAGVRFRSIMLDVDAVAGIADYLRKTPSLIFLVAMPHDPLARRLAEELIPACDSHTGSARDDRGKVRQATGDQVSLNKTVTSNDGVSFAGSRLAKTVMI